MKRLITALLIGLTMTTSVFADNDLFSDSEVSLKETAIEEGYEVSWNQETRSVLLNKEGSEITVFVDQDRAIVNGQEQIVDVKLENGTTKVPFHFVKENMIPSDIKELSEVLDAESIKSIHFKGIKVDKAEILNSNPFDFKYRKPHEITAMDTDVSGVICLIDMNENKVIDRLEAYGTENPKIRTHIYKLEDLKKATHLGVYSFRNDTMTIFPNDLIGKVVPDEKVDINGRMTTK